MRVIPIWEEKDKEPPKITKFFGQFMKSGAIVEMDLPEAKESVLVCTPIMYYNAEKLYLEEMKKLAEKYCTR
jgi:hypothetical protein